METSSRHDDQPGLKSNQVAMNLMLDFKRFEPFDSEESHRKAAQLDRQLMEACKEGELHLVEQILTTIRESDDPIINRPSAWKWRNVAGNFLKEAYENKHWNIIEYLARQPEIELMPPTSNMGTWSLPGAVAQRAVITNDTAELEKLLELGWDINQCVGHQNDYWPSMTPPVLSLVLDSEDIVLWFLLHGADVNAACDVGLTPLIIAAREAKLLVLQLLLEHDGKYEDSDLIAQAALGDSWGKPDRMEVIKYLLQIGLPIDKMAGSTWEPLRRFKEWTEEYRMITYDGGQTALHIAQNAGNKQLAAFLLESGADPSIQPIQPYRIEPPESGNFI